MSGTTRQFSTGDPEQPTAGLENHLRNLILSNPVPGQDGTSQALSSPEPRAQFPSSIASTGSGHISRAQDNVPNTDAAGNTATQSSSQQQHKSSRKRLNQAQRRQMSSQLSIPVDTRPHSFSSSKPHFNPHEHPSRTSPPEYQRHMYSNSHPRVIAHGNHPHNSNPGNHWNRHQQQYVPTAPGYHPFNSNHQRNSSSAGYEHMPSHTRNGSGYLQYNRRPHHFTPEEVTAQAAFLDRTCYHVVASSEIGLSEIADKEAFRCWIEAISREAITRFEQTENSGRGFPPSSVELKCFGSLSSGFATKASDMDLGLLSPLSTIQPDAPGSQIPRLLEKAFLDAGLGARLLTRTRVPIIKLCENPPEKLRKDLLAEREKWENGIDSEPPEPHDDDDHEQAIPYHDKDEKHGSGLVAEDVQMTNGFTVPNKNTGEQQRFYLHQAPKKSLSAYYGLAKQVLRKAGGRDVTISNVKDFTDLEWEILNGICEAFVNGLSNQALRERLYKYPSLRFPPKSDAPEKRSLAGVFLQIEGEQLLEQWERRVVTDRHRAQEMNAVQVLEAWEESMSKTNFDCVFYMKELQLILDKIKRIPSVQFISLTQGQYETPKQYHLRTNELLGLLGTLEGKPASRNDSAIVKQYIAGIHSKEIRAGVQDAIDSSSSKSPHLAAVARRHKSLHLAWEFEKALDKDLYAIAHIEVIKEYVNLLRSPNGLDSTSGSDADFTIPVTHANARILAIIQQLSDPHNMSANQPRDRYRDRLEFPKTGVGVQCDINFSAHLALQNTLLLRCYSHADPRVRPMVLFIKHWAKVRGINSGYRGTLSSYGYVLMVLHYLVNVAQPFVCPNLQALAPQPPENPSLAEIENTLTCKGYNIQFWRNEEEIIQLARANQLTHNTESLGQLLRGFFEYFAQSGILSSMNGIGFDWGRDVLSLRTPGGRLSKHAKGWVGAKTVVEVQGGGPSSSPTVQQAPAKISTIGTSTTLEPNASTKTAAPVNRTGDVKEVRYRYLFAIEDPFELEHNVARTVTHNGIVAIRDEFRRAWRIIKSAGHGTPQEDLLADVNDVVESTSPFLQLLEDIHGSLVVRAE